MIKFVILVCILLALYGVLVYSIGKLNLSHERRFLQVHYVAASVIYSLAVSAAFIILLGGIDGIMSVKYLNDIVLEGVPAKSYSPAFMLLIILIGNDLYMLGAFIVLAIARSGRIRSKGYGYSAVDTELESVANRYYEIEDAEGWPFLRDAYITTSKWMGAVRKFILALYIIWVLAACIMLYSGSEAVSAMLLSALKYFFIIISAAYVPIAEMGYFLEGISKYEDITEFDIDEVGLRRVGDYERLVRHFQSKYPDMIVNNGNCLVPKAYVQQGGPNDVGEQMVKRSNNSNAFNSIIKSIKYNSTEMSENNYTEAVLSLVNGESIVVADSIYGEILLYVAAYINYKLSSGGRVLIVTSYKARVERIREELKDRLGRINDLDPIWKIGTIEDNWAETADIVICPIDKLDLISNKEFSSQIGCVIVDDPSGSFVSSEVAQRMSYMKITGELVDTGIQYIFICNDDNRNLEESLEHIIGKDLKSYKSSTAQADFFCMVWKNESFSQPQTRIGIQPYIGNSSLISLEAARMGVRSIGLWVDGTVPYITYKDLMMQNIDEIRQKFLRTTAINMNDIILLNASENYRKRLLNKGFNTSDREKNDLKFIIEYDVDNDLLTVAKAWSNYALDKNTIITIVSDSYMLRGYMADNLARLVHSPTTIKQIIPSKGEDVHRSNELLMLRLYKGMRSDYLIEAYNSFNGTNYMPDEIEECLGALLKDICPERLIQGGVYGCFTFKYDAEFTVEKNYAKYVAFYMIRLTNSKVYEYVLNKINYAKIRFGSADEVIVLPVDTEDIYNYYLPNQMHCFDGELAVIKKIKPSGEIIIERTTPQDVRHYVQTADYYAENCSGEVEYVSHSGYYKLSEVHADLKWVITGYYNFKKGNQLYVADSALGRRETFVHSKQIEHISVERKHKRGFVLRLGKVCENKEKVELTMALMMNELFKTLLPDNYNDISAFVVMTDEMDRLLKELPQEERVIADIIPALRFSDFESSDAPEIVLFEKSASEKGLLTEIIDEVNLQNIFDIMYSYLKWEMEIAPSGDDDDDDDAAVDDRRYLNFGFEKYPSLLDIPGILGYLESVRTMNDVSAANTFDYMDITNDFCPYCGRPLGVEAVCSDDGRLMCVECRNQIVKSEKEIHDIYRDASEKLKRRYHLGKKLWNIRKIGFKNVREIIRMTGSDKVLGFYDAGKRTLWVLKAVPRAYEFSTLVHEMVHAWQHENFSKKAYDDRNLTEGHAMWVEVEMARLEHQEAYANYLEYCLEHDLIIASIADEHGNVTNFSYGDGYKEMKRRMSHKKESEDSFDVARQWAAEIGGGIL